ncbi:MAG: VOC family protein [Chloroflexi bacterium]|nr:VOC family protein [Chloroflexota bacterium]
MVQKKVGCQVAEINTAVFDLNKAMEDAAKMGWKEFRRFTSPEPPVQAHVANAKMGDNEVYLTVMASTEEGSPIDRFLKKRGEGIFSITLFCDDLDDVIKRWKAAGVEFVIEKPWELKGHQLLGKTFKRSRVTWSKPKGPAHGLVFELWQHEE